MVVTDINMPRMDGLTLLGRLQEEATSFSTIIVSAYGDMANIRTAMNRGAFDFLTKPIDFADFETTMRKTIAHVAALRDARERQAAAERAHASLVALFLAQSRAQPRGRRQRAGAGRRAARDRDAVHRHRRLHAAGRIARYRRSSPSCSANISTGMTEIVFAHEGTVAKIIGDAIHVLFGAPGDQPDAATPRDRLRARARRLRAEAFRREWNARGVPLGVTRIGVHAGPAIVGNFGGGRLFDYTAYGDTINAAARLEAVNKKLGTRICVSAVAAERAGEFLRPAGRRPRAARPQRAVARLRAACARSRRGEPARTPIAGLRQARGAATPSRSPPSPRWSARGRDDALAQYHLKRLLNGHSGTRIESDLSRNARSRRRLRGGFP